MKLFKTRQRDERGQVLVIVAAGLVVIVAMVGLVIDGGYAWGQQRKAQNGADAMSLAGAVVLAENLGGTTPAKTNGDVGCAVEAAATANGIATPVGYYTDITGTYLNPSVQVGPCSPGQGGLVPAAAAGVKAGGDRTFKTFLMSVIGFTQLTASARATAVAGLLTSVCPADAGCGILPVTFPLTQSTCDGTSQLQIGTAKWPIVQTTDPNAPNYASAANEVIVPICKTSGPGSVGWLDLGCGTLAHTISVPCNITIPIPVWLHTQTGNVNSLGAELNAYAGPQIGVPDDSVVTIPINKGTCAGQPPNSVWPCPASLGGPDSGQGNNFYYYIPKFIGFMLDQAYVQGADAGPTGACNTGVGQPYIGGNGGAGCFKGWFVKEITYGTVGPGASGPQDPGLIGVQLIR